MRALRSLLLLFACSILSAPLLAQQATSTSTAPAVSDPQAVALVQKALVALTGGVAVTDVTLTGTARRIAGSDDESGSATLEADSTSDSRVQLSFSSGNRMEIHNHAAIPLPGTFPPGGATTFSQTLQPVGAWSGSDGVLHPVVPPNLSTSATWFFPAFTLANLAASPNYILSYLGEETLNGQAVLHISASQPYLINSSGQPTTPAPAPSLMQQLSRMDLYFDPTTLLPVALVFAVHPDNNASVDIAMQIFFSNYQAVKSVRVPYHVQELLNNGLVLDLQFSSAILNSGLSTSAFAIQ